jgi:hypothetical protein
VLQTTKVIAALLMAVQVMAMPGADAANLSQGKQTAAAGKTVCSMPYCNTYSAPGNLALQQAGQKQLPTTRLDSFVAESGYNDKIYGGENCIYDGFTQEHRIERGIVGERAKGLTTNHGSVLPSAWGKDEFIAQEADAGWSMSGAETQELSLPAVSEDPEVADQPWQDASEIVGNSKW